MEATKKTSTTKAALLVIAALSMLLSGLFLATASRSDASPPPACPDGFSLTADAKNCFQAAVITSADNPNSCDAGQLTPDGTKCYTAARVIPQEGDTLCPAGFSPDDSLGGMCARFEPAPQRGPACPEGARGIAGGCYILVAKGPSGDAACTDGTLSGSVCVITGTAPTNAAGSCPVSATVLLDGNFCYTLVSADPGSLSCGVAAYTLFEAQGICKASNPDSSDPVAAFTFACPAGPTGVTVEETMHNIGNSPKIASCQYNAIAGPGSCTAPLVVDTNANQCRRTVELRPGALTCATGFGLVDGDCIRYANATTADPQCPIGSVEDTVGDCRKPVADATGAFYCEDAEAALNGTSCVYTSGFLSAPAPNLYKCDEGTRTVIGPVGASQNICILGDSNPNTTSGPSCLQGVLSTDNAYCIVPRIDTAPVTVAAPVPSFTG